MNGKGYYLWTDPAFVSWIDLQKKKIKETHSLEIGRTTMTKMLTEKILIPNEVDLSQLFKPRIRMQKKWKYNPLVKNEQKRY